MNTITMTDRRTVDPNILRQLRESKRLARTGLAKKANLSERQLRRIEDSDAPTVSVRDNTLMNLAKALEVEPSVLTGESPAPKVTPRPAPAERSAIRAMIEPKARLGYTLLKQRYGVNATDLINMAPLFFTLLAEGSLAWRREQLEAAEEAMGRASALGNGHLACMKARAFLKTTQKPSGGSGSLPSRATPKLSMFWGPCTASAKAFPRTTPKPSSGIAAPPSRVTPRVSIFSGTCTATAKAFPGTITKPRGGYASPRSKATEVLSILSISCTTKARAPAGGWESQPPLRSAACSS